MRPDDRIGQWWQEPVGDDVHEVVFEQARKLVDADKHRVSLIRTWYDMYKDRKFREAGMDSYFRDRRSRSNVLTGGIDAVHARHARVRPIPQVVTTAGSIQRQRKAKNLTRYLIGEFTRLDVHKKASKILKQGLIAGTGILKGHIDTGDGMPTLEIVRREELHVDPVEEACNHVRTMYQVKQMDRGVIKAMYPEFTQELEDSESIQATSDAVYGDMVDVVEVWHLRSGPDSDDGRRVICTSNCTLKHVEWNWDRFPFSFFCAYDDPESFWGISLAERMAGAQSELNDITEKISEGAKLAVPMFIVGNDSGLQTKQMDNEPMRQYVVQGPLSESVMHIAPSGIAPEHVDYQERLRQRVLEDNGISQLSAHSEKPAGLNSGKALLVHQDVETGRFAVQAQDYEALHVDIAELLLKLLDEAIEDMEEGEDDSEEEADDAEDTKSKLSVLVEERGVLYNLSYKDVRMAEDDPYRVKVFPISSLSNSPQGRINEVSELIQLGVLTDPGAILELLAMPDLEQYKDVETASRNLADSLIEAALEGEKVYAHKYLPLDYTIRRGIQHLNLAQLQGAPDADLDALRDFIGHAETILEQEQAKMQPPAPPLGAAPPMPPMPGAPPMQGAA